MESTIDEILVSRNFDLARSRARSRVVQAVRGEIKTDDTIPHTAELLSYPITRIMVSCIDDAFLTRRYALAEAKFAYASLKGESDKVIQEIGLDFGINASINDGIFTIHFTDYIRGAAGMRAREWKLVNRRLESGNVNIKKEQFARLLQEAVRVRISANLPLDVPEALCGALQEYTTSIRDELTEAKSEFDEEGFGEVEPENFPPCMIHLLSSAQGGINLAHSARFALTTFLLNIGLTVERIMQMFSESPDFNEEMTRYQVEHIAGATGTTYKTPSCATMVTYGNCYGRNETCRVGHPLGYYKKKKQACAVKPDESGPLMGQNDGGERE